MAVQYNFLKPIDQKVRDQGYDFVSQDEYLQDGFKPTSGISYAGDGSPVSYANSGIMTQAPIPGPLKYTPQEGDGGGGKPPGPAVDNSQFDYETEAYGIDPAYGLTEEEQKALDASIAGPKKMGKLSTLGTIGAFFASPLTTIGYLHRRDKKEQKRLDDAVVAAGIEADFQRNRDNLVTDSSANYTGGRYDGAPTKDAYDAEPTAYSGSSKDGGLMGYGGKSGTPRYQQYLNGGRVGYFFGGRVNYKVGGRVSFKNGGLASIL